MQGSKWLMFGGVALLLLAVISIRADDDNDDDDNDDDDDEYYGDLHRTLRGSDNDENDVAKMSLPEVQQILKSVLAVIDDDDDGLVEKDELEDWIDTSAKLLRDEETEEDFEEGDANDDELLSWAELLKHFGIDEAQASSDEFEENLEDYKELFDEADENDDGMLTKEEYFDYSQPEEDKRMLEVLLKQTMDRQDQNKDGKLTYQEFTEFSEDEDTSKDEFDEEDQNDDGFLDKGEVRSWLTYNYTTEIYELVEELLKEADDDRDGRLSYDELLEEPQLLQRNLLLEIGVQLQRRGLLKGEELGTDSTADKDEL